MKINAYILAADPAWIEASVSAYYDLVERVVISYDRDSLSWTGKSLDVEQCLSRLRRIDRQRKLDYQPGHYARPDFFKRPMESETHQRCVALECAGRDADWVLQLDTDEVIGDPAIFRDCLAEAHHTKCQALNYPSLWLYSHAFGRWYLQWCHRGWRRHTGYPGPVAIHSGIPVVHARRIEGEYFHVDLTRSGSSERVPNGIAVDRVIDPRAAVWHFSAVRDEYSLRQKFGNWGHAVDRDYNPELARWLWTTKHPLLATLSSQFQRGPYKRPLKLSRIPRSVEARIAASSVSFARLPQSCDGTRPTNALYP